MLDSVKPLIKTKLFVMPLGITNGVGIHDIFASPDHVISGDAGVCPTPYGQYPART